MDRENSWTAVETIYKAGDEPDFAYLLTKSVIELCLKKVQNWGVLTKMRLLRVIDSIKYKKKDYCNCSKRIKSITDSKKTC